MKDYLVFYLKYDVFLLANVFEKSSLKNYESCPSHSLSAQGLIWEATLKMTKIELELIPDPNM